MTAQTTLEMKLSHIANMNAQLDQKTRLLQEAETTHQQTLSQRQAQIEKLNQQLADLSRANESLKEQLNLLQSHQGQQSSTMVSLESRYAEQLRLNSEMERRHRAEADQAEMRYRQEVQHLQTKIRDSEQMLADMRSRMEMHSIGIEEVTKRHDAEKEHLIAVH
jgi:hypothetical protein